MGVAEQLVPVGSWKSDGVHSSVGVEVEHMGVSTFRASFTDFEASLLSGPNGVELRGGVSVDSFDVRDDGLRPHVMGPEFLDVDHHPELSFQSTALRGEGDELVVDGVLAIRGTTRTIQGRGRIGQPIVDPYGNERLALTLETVIDRTDYGLDWQMELPSGGVALGNDVKLLVSLELVKQG
jgi:polyisoprenoid-binding protein YceI